MNKLTLNKGAIFWLCLTIATMMSATVLMEIGGYFIFVSVFCFATSLTSFANGLKEMVTEK